MNSSEFSANRSEQELNALRAELESRIDSIQKIVKELQQTAASHTQLTSTKDEIFQRLDIVKQEVDILQVEVKEPKRPWYRDPSILISILAVVFSFYTSFVSYTQVQEQDRRAARAELRGLLQRMSALPKENVDLFKTYEADAATISQLSGLVNQEYTLLAEQALELADRIPEDISAFEYGAIANSLFTAGVSAQVPALIEKGLAVSSDPVAEEYLYRLYGGYLFSTGDVTGGRAKFQQALDVSRKYSLKNTYYIEGTRAVTEIGWANAEYSQGLCSEAEALLASASDRIDKLAPGQIKDTLRGQVEAGQSFLQRNRQNCID